jgi:hypothetical protein
MRVEGERVRVHYGEVGAWNDVAAAAGYQVRFEQDWVEVSYAGAPFHLFAVRAAGPGGAESYYASGFDQSSNFVLKELTDISDELWARVKIVHEAGSIRAIRTEEWALDSMTMRVHVALENISDSNLNGLTLLFAYESDQENNDPSREDKSANDVKDLDDNGLPDWVESVGIQWGWTTGIGVCDEADVELGHFSDWGGVQDADEPLSDEDGVAEDWAMGIRVRFDQEVEPGGIVDTVFLVVADPTQEGAQAAYLEAREICGGAPIPEDTGQDSGDVVSKDERSGCAGCSSLDPSGVGFSALFCFVFLRKRRASGQASRVG